MNKSVVAHELDQTTTATTPEAPPGRIFAPSLDAGYRLKQSDVSGAFPYLMLRQLKRHGYKGRLRFFGDCGGQLARVF